MAISQIGALIRWRRSELGLSQEELADGICSVTTLSRIENGERMPTQNHLELLLQRIGYSDMMLQTFVDEKDFIAHELKYDIRQAYIENDINKSKELLQQFRSQVVTPSQIDAQFILLFDCLIDWQSHSPEESLEKLERALRMTLPKYRSGHFPPMLSYQEILLLNNIGLRLVECGDTDGAIDIFYGLVEYYDSRVVNREEALRTEPMILYNLSKYLGLEGRYDECIAICEKGIKLAQKTGRSSYLPQTFYNKAWALIKRNGMGDVELAQDAILKAYYTAEAFGNLPLANHCKGFAQSNGLEL